MSDEKKFGTVRSMQAQSSHCGLRPSKEAMEEGFGVDFSEAKSLLEKSSQISSDKEALSSDTTPKKINSEESG